MRDRTVFDRRPGAKAVTGLGFIRRLSFVEKRTGIKDAKENQVCVKDDGHITPYACARYGFYEGYVNDAYTLADEIMKDYAKEAEKLITELSLIMSYKTAEPTGNSEERARQARLGAAKIRADCERAKDLMIRLSELKASIMLLANKLSLHVDAAGDLMDAHVSNYWRGVLKASRRGDVSFAPVFDARAYDSRTKFLSDKEDLLERLGSAMSAGGDYYEKNV